MYCDYLMQPCLTLAINQKLCFYGCKTVFQWWQVYTLNIKNSQVSVVCVRNFQEIFMFDSDNF